MSFLANVVLDFFRLIYLSGQQHQEFGSLPRDARNRRAEFWSSQKALWGRKAEHWTRAHSPDF